MHILITGGSGFLGKSLTDFLLSGSSELKKSVGNDIEVSWVSRSKDTKSPKSVEVFTYDELVTSSESFDVIINLAGVGIADSRWSDKRKQQLHSSRLKPTQAVLDYLNNKQDRPNVLNTLFISGSAIGWYGSQQLGDSTVLTEDTAVVTKDFAHDLCEQWEKLALTATELNDVNVAIIRTGLVMSSETSNGGMIARLKVPFSMGLGGELASGQQMMSWISLRDWIRAVEFIILAHVNAEYPTNEVTDNKNNAYKNSNNRGHMIYNLTAVTPITNAQFTKAVGTWLKRPTIFKQPSFVLNALFGEMATLLIDGQRVRPQQLLNSGFEFRDKDIAQALK